MATPRSHDLTTGPVGGHLRRQATPFGLGLVAILSFDAIDLFFIAQLGNAQLAAISFCLPITWLVYAIGIGFEAGAASCVSRAVGRKDEARAARLTTDTVLLGIMVAILIGLLGLATIEPLFSLLGATRDLLPIIREYMQVWYWVAPLDLALWTMLASIRARGNTLLESKLITGAALLNLALDPVFIFGLFGFPRLGVAGAALATVVATLIILVISTVLLAARYHVFARIRAPLAERLDSWRHVMQIGLPAVFTNAIIPISSGVVVRIISGSGVEAVAGYGIAMRIEPLALIPFYALSAVNSPFFGQNSGAGQFQRLREALRISGRFCVAYGLALGVVLALLAPMLVGLFTATPAIAAVAMQYLWLVAWSWGGHGIVMSVNAGFNGSGKPLPAVVISSCRVLIVLLPLLWLGQALFGLVGIFAAIAASNLLVAAMAWNWLGRHIRQMELSAPTYPPPSHES
jgi:putative MATE family efflux protein